MLRYPEKLLEHCADPRLEKLGHTLSRVFAGGSARSNLRLRSDDGQSGSNQFISLNW
jgi:hypothetical protein